MPRPVVQKTSALALRGRKSEVENSPVACDLRSCAACAQRGPKGDVVCGQNGSTKSMLQRLDHANRAEAVAAHKDAVSTRWNLRADPAVELIRLNGLFIGGQ